MSRHSPARRRWLERETIVTVIKAFHREVFHTVRQGPVTRQLVETIMVNLCLKYNKQISMLSTSLRTFSNHLFWLTTHIIFILFTSNATVIHESRANSLMQSYSMFTILLSSLKSKLFHYISGFAFAFISSFFSEMLIILSVVFHSCYN